MSIAKQVEERIKGWPEQKVFRVQDLLEYQQRPKAVSEALSRLVKKETIVRLGKGRFYKPRITRFGKIRPKESAILESFFFTNKNRKKKQIAYLTGVSLYYEWGLTTQVPSEVQLASTESSFFRDIAGIRIRAEKIKVASLDEKKTRILQVLDVLKGIKNIPDANPKKVLAVVEKNVRSFDENSIREAERLAVNYYRPSVVALLGAVMEDALDYQSKKLKDKISPFSKYKAGISPSYLLSSERWQLQ